MTPEYILRKSLVRPAHCSEADVETRARQIEYVTWAPAYSERGYTDSKKGILFGNWNYFAVAATNLLEKYGYEIEWEDEWTTCGDCGKAVRTSPDSYGWQPSHVILHECETVCIDCLNGDAAEYLEELEDNPRRAVNADVDPTKWGYILIKDGFENGWYDGQDDDPKNILADLRAEGHSGPFVFKVDSVGQFDISFSVYEKTSAETEAA